MVSASSIRALVVAAGLTTGSAVWFYFFASLLTKGGNRSDFLEISMGAGLVLSSLLLPFLGWLMIRQSRGAVFYGVVFAAFLISLAPLVIILCLLLVVIIVPRGSDTPTI
jgi:cytochrome bd-type quinol oxidase subunit 2